MAQAEKQVNALGLASLLFLDVMRCFLCAEAPSLHSGRDRKD
jgi:hypothetical protein